MRLRRAALILLLLVVFPVIAWVVWDRVEASRLSRRLDALFPQVDAGDSQRVAASTSSETEKEALGLYTEAGLLATPPPLEASKLPRQETSKTIETLSAFPTTVAARDPRLDDLRKIEQTYAQSLQLIDRASALDAPMADGAETPSNIGTLLHAADVNTVRIARLALAGTADAAADALMASLRLRRLALWSGGRETFVTTHSLALTLTFAPPSEPMLQQLQREYRAIADQQDHVVEDTLVGQRYQLARGVAPEEFGASSSYLQRQGPVFRILARLGRGFRNDRLIAELDRYEEALAIAKQPWPARLDAAHTLSEKYGTPRRSASGLRRWLDDLLGMFAGAATIGLPETTAAAAEAVARARVADVVLGIERYRRANRGSVPSALAALVPAYVPAVPIDPFSGRELIYRRTPDAYKVYSVGSNRRDDGGQWYVQSDLNHRRRGDPTDVGIGVRAQP
jgi:hypothetical protein